MPYAIQIRNNEKAVIFTRAEAKAVKEYVDELLTTIENNQIPKGMPKPKVKALAALREISYQLQL